MSSQKSELLLQAEQTTEVIRKHTKTEPRTAIILGTGLGGFAKEIETEAVIPYEELPYFPLSTVESHSGKLIFGKVRGKNIVAMQGRFHLYEGYTFQQITYPVRILKLLGVKTLLVSNASGTMNPLFKKGHVMLIDDHINLLGGNPLVGEHDNFFGTRFPDMSEPYSKELIEKVEKIAIENKIPLYKGVYAAMTGPSLETRAEYRMLRIIGADAIGMSTIPEVIVAKQMGMKVLGLSILTDECDPDALKPLDISEIIKTAESAEPYLTKILLNLIPQI
ncbi:MAG: purine-nucleoside phosphorylase [Bacteroidota bacterium]|jgi:purine-nucleoside phosphorylase